MAIKKTRQRQRGGPYSKFDKTKTLPREFQIVESGDPNSKDGRAVYIAFEAGEPKRLSTYEDMQEDIDNATEEIQGTLTAGVDKKIKEADAAITSAKSAATKANTATTNANKATDSANKAADNANKAVENIQSKVGINDRQPSDVTTYSGNKIEEMAQTNWIPEYMYDTVKGVRANWVYEKGKLVINDTEPEETGHSYVYIIVKVKTDTQYTVSWKSTRTGEKGGGIWVNGKDNSVIVSSHYSELNGAFTFDTGNNDQIRVLFIGTASSNYGGKPGDSATFEEVMLVEGANKSNYVKNARDIVRECAEVRGEIGTIKAYDTLADVCKAFGIKTKPYTAAELLLALPRNIHVSFTNNKDDGNEYVTDAPVKYGIIDVNTGNSLSYNNAIISDSSNMNKIYRFKTDANTNNNDGWTKILTEQDIVGNLTTTVTGKVLDALMGKKLKDEIDALNSALMNKIVLGSDKNTTLIVTDQTLKFVGGAATVNLNTISSAYQKTAGDVIAQLKSASAAVITSANVSKNIATIKCSNLSGTPYEGEIAITLLIFMS